MALDAIASRDVLVMNPAPFSPGFVRERVPDRP